MDVPVFQAAEQAPSSDVKRHLVVGLGASAGGLQALRAFLAHLPACPGIACVLVQHTTPGEDGLLLDVLRPLSPLPVKTAQDGAAPEPDWLHVAPAGHVVRLRRGRFQVRLARGIEERRTSVDRFFRSLAEDAGPCAVGVVLSGSGSDGALGLEAIGAAGGLTMAQAAGTAAQAEMPESAAAVGPCDHVLPPEELAQALLAYAAHVHHLPGGPAGVARHRVIHAAVPRMCDTLRRVTGNDFRHYKTSTLVRRLERRMQVLQVASVDDYLARLDSDEGEARTLFRELLIGVTSFFRDPEAFEALASKVLKPLLSERSSSDELRLWVPGCATGEEAYSVAMLAREMLDGLSSPPRIQIFATDIDERALAAARRGSYPQGIAAQVSPERLARFFVRKGRRYQVAPELREMCLFTAHNLVSDPPFSRLDLISCRNLLIYMGPHLQKKLFPVFHYALKPGGYLFLGSSESLAGQSELFRAVDAKARLAQRKDTRGVPPDGLRAFGGQGLPGFRSPDQTAEPDLGAIAQRILLAEFAPRYAIVSEQGQAVHLSEGVDRYLQPPVGTYSSVITRMARRGLSAGLRSSLAQAVRRRRTVVHELPAVQTTEGLARVRLTVQPMPELGHGEGLYMVVFEDLGAAMRPVAEAGAASPEAEAVIDGLERELAHAREEVERAAQDQEAANEELKSSNEELLSMNEELQSANEELEASKEEVQAANRSLEQANVDLENLLRSTQIATVFLDRDGHVRSFTPAAAEIYNLRSFDVGRPLRELRSLLADLPDVPSFAEVASQAEPLEHVARHADGRWFLRRVLPTRGSEGMADGVLVTFVDITSRKRAEEEQQRATALLSAVGETTPDLIFVKNRQGRLLYANPATLRAIGRTTAEALGRNELEWHGDRAEAEAIMAADAEVMASGETRVIEERFTSPDDGHTRIFRGTKSPMRDGTGTVVGLVGVATDVTQSKKAEEALRAALEFNRRILDSSGDCIKVLSLGGHFESMSSGGMGVMEVDDFASLRGACWPDLWKGQGREAALAALGEARRGGTGRFQGAADTAKGTPKYWDVVVTPILDAEGRPEKLLSISRDITEQRRAEERLREAATVVENMGEGFLVLDPQFRIRQINAEGLRIDGRPAEQILGHPILKVWPEAEHLPTWPLYQNAMTERTAGELVYQHLSDVHDVWLEVRVYPVGEGLAIFYRDVTDREQAHAAQQATAERLSETSRRLDAVLNNTTMAVFVMDDRQHCIYANAAAEQLTGYRFEEMQGLPLHDVVHHTHPDGTPYPLEDCPIDRAFPENAHTQGEEVFVHKDGHFYPVAFTASPIRDESSQTVGTIIEARGIADEIAARAALAESEAKFRTIANAMPQMVWSTRPDGYHDFYNDRWYEFTGVPAGSTDGEGWNDMFHPSDQEQARARWSHSLTTGEPYEIEYRLRHRSGQYRWVLGRALPVRDEAGRIVRWMGTCTDIEDQKRIEAELAEALQTKDVLLHEVNHRVKNSLQLVTSLLMLQASQARSPELKQALLEARGRLSVVSAMHQRLYSTSQHDRVDFGDYLRDMARETLRSLGGEQRAELVTDVESDVVFPLAQAVPLALVVSELVTNAVKYAFQTCDKGRLQVTLQRTNGGVRIEVADDGVGLPEGFDPLRSGGLGMKIVTSLVRQVRGQLTVDQTGPGTRFMIDLPIPGQDDEH
ncbi:PAS domain-containing protein [Rubellimicrobium rubrum]|nr:PAS domain-containing protein [Rubellimicrobium rubrum]